MKKLNPIFEQLFINDSYACRKNRGTHYGIKRIDQLVKECSNGYTTDCYILKLDIQGFFMHIDRNILFQHLQTFVDAKYQLPDKSIITELCKKIIFNMSAQNCIIKGTTTDWQGLPHSKSLFYSPSNCGLPIGNLTSQVFANFYMHPFDNFVKNELKIIYYGRYVDDFVIVHESKFFFLQEVVPKLSDFLCTDLKLTLHPQKIYLQHYRKGVRYLGAIVLPHRTYIANRTKGNFHTAITKQNIIARHHKPSKEEQEAFLSCMNSYLGIMAHYKTYKLRKYMVSNNLSCWWSNLFYCSGFRKFVKRTKSVKNPKTQCLGTFAHIH